MELASRPARTWIARCWVVAWLAGVGSIALAWAESYWYAFHPHWLPLLALFATLVVSTFLSVALGAWGVIRGPHRVRAAIIALTALLPAGFWVWAGFHAASNWSVRRVPNTLLMNTARLMGGTLMRAELDLRYPHRLETERLVMFYHALAAPERDLAEMDRHLARLEAVLGGPITGRVYWVRGRLLGQGYVSFHGLALGSQASPDSSAEVAADFRVDRHELAHAALDWFRSPGSDPPYLLHEGWAVAQSGDDRRTLAQQAAGARLDEPWTGPKALLQRDWYYRDQGPVYSIGGAFVEYLIRTHGAAKFRRLYTECTPDTIEEKCQAILGVDLETLEAAFWRDVTATLESPPNA